MNGSPVGPGGRCFALLSHRSRAEAIRSSSCGRSSDVCQQRHGPNEGDKSKLRASSASRCHRAMTRCGGREWVTAILYCCSQYLQARGEPGPGGHSG